MDAREIPAEDQKQLDRIEAMLVLLCEKLGVSVSPDKSVKAIDDWAKTTIIRLQSRKKGK